MSQFTIYLVYIFDSGQGPRHSKTHHKTVIEKLLVSVGITIDRYLESSNIVLERRLSIDDPRFRKLSVNWSCTFDSSETQICRDWQVQEWRFHLFRQLCRVNINLLIHGIQTSHHTFVNKYGEMIDELKCTYIETQKIIILESGKRRHYVSRVVS